MRAFGNYLQPPGYSLAEVSVCVLREQVDSIIQTHQQMLDGTPRVVGLVGEGGSRVPEPSGLHNIDLPAYAAQFRMPQADRSVQ